MGCSGSKTAKPSRSAGYSPSSKSNHLSVSLGDAEIAAIAAALCEEGDKQGRPSGACCAVLNSKGGGLLSLRVGAAGLRQRGSDNLVTDADLWHLGSCGKAITATLIAVLVSQQKIPGGYDATVASVLSAGSHCGTGFDASYGPVTLRQLLTHTGSLTTDPAEDAWALAWQLAISGKPLRQQRSEFLTACLSRAAPSGDAVAAALTTGRYEYSNQGYALAAHMAEVATGIDYETMLKDVLFTPLGMASAEFGAQGAPDGCGKTPDVVARSSPWGHGEQSGWEAKDPRDGNADNPSPITPAGRIHATMADWAAFVAVHVDKEAAKKALGIDGDAFDSMHAKHEPSTGDYCLAGFIPCTRGWQRGSLCLNHAGSNTFNFCSVWATEGAATLVTTNHGGCAGVVDAAHGKLLQQAGLIK
jgi:CubicO group peptidase (beta-lactamase class C family)